MFHKPRVVDMSFLNNCCNCSKLIILLCPEPLYSGVCFRFHSIICLAVTMLYKRMQGCYTLSHCTVLHKACVLQRPWLSRKSPITAVLLSEVTYMGLLKQRLLLELNYLKWHKKKQNNAPPPSPKIYVFFYIT